MSEQDNMAALMQAFGDHEITNDEGQIAETETAPDSSPEEQTTVDEPTPVETPHSQERQAPEAQSFDEETPVEDETGKRYVPESRFKEVYAKQKQLERELQAARQQTAKPTAVKQTKAVNVDQRTVQLENELLFATLPQFNPEHPDHDDVLDEMAVEIYTANPGMTKIQAARKAIERAAKLQKKTLEAKTEARQVKQLQADHGITSRVVSRQDTKVNPNEMSLDEMEAYLKDSGEWNNRNFVKN